MDDANLDLVVGELEQGRLHRLGGAAHVSLHNDLQFLGALGNLRKQIVQIDLGICLELCFLNGRTALICQRARHSFVLDGIELVARFGNLVQTDDLHRHGRTCCLELSALIVCHGTDTPHRSTRDDHVAAVERTVLHKYGRHWTAAAIQLCLDDDTLCAAIGVRAQILHFGNQQNAFQKVIDAHTRQCGDRHADHVAAPLLGNEIILGERLLNLIGVGARLIHFIDSDHDIQTCVLCVVDGFYGLRHDAVVGGDHQNGDVGRLCAACTHGGERLMTGRIQEGDILTADIHAICADRLCDTARLAGGHIGVPNLIEQGGLTVVNVTHHAHDGSARHQRFLGVLFLLEQTVFDGDHHLAGRLDAHFVGDQECGVVVHYLIDGRHNAEHEELFDHLSRRNL